MKNKEKSSKRRKLYRHVTRMTAQFVIISFKLNTNSSIKGTDYRKLYFRNLFLLSITAREGMPVSIRIKEAESITTQIFLMFHQLEK